MARRRTDPHEAADGRRVLVVGLGFIGTHVARTLAGSGLICRALTRSEVAEGARPDGVAVVHADAADERALAAALDGVDHVVYCAGTLMPATSNLQPVADIGLTLPPLIAVLEALRHRPGVSLTFISSGGTVYGHPDRLPVPEDHPTDPITSYGVMKLASEKYVGMYRHLYGIRARVLRCSNVYGEGQPVRRGQGAIAAFLHRALAGEPVVVFGDGSTIRDYLYVGDLAALVERLLRCPEGPGVLNVGSGIGTSLNEVLTIVDRIARPGTGRPLRVEHRPARSFDVDRIVLDTTELRRLVPFEPLPLEAGIRRTWDALTAGRFVGALALWPDGHSRPRMAPGRAVGSSIRPRTSAP